VTAGTVVLAVDVSRSMNGADVEPNRLTAALDAARAFLKNVPPAFRVGLVTFATEPTVVIPPTLDRAQLLGALTALTTRAQVGTVIGDGLYAAVQAIQNDGSQQGDRPSAVVLLTDGKDSGSAVAPDRAAGRAKQLGIPIFTVAISQPAAAGALSASGASGLDLLRQIASMTGAKSFTTSSADQLTQVYASLGSRLSYELAVGDNAGPFVIAAVLLTLIAVVLVLLDLRDPYEQPSPSKGPRHR
jgi:Ca-activated chloride channel family protein